MPVLSVLDYALLLCRVSCLEFPILEVGDQRAASRVCEYKGRAICCRSPGRVRVLVQAAARGALAMIGPSFGMLAAITGKP